MQEASAQHTLLTLNSLERTGYIPLFGIERLYFELELRSSESVSSSRLGCLRVAVAG